MFSIVFFDPASPRLPPKKQSKYLLRKSKVMPAFVLTETFLPVGRLLAAPCAHWLLYRFNPPSLGALGAGGSRSLGWKEERAARGRCLTAADGVTGSEVNSF